MSTLEKGPLIEVTVTLDSNKAPQFSYMQDGQQTDGSVVVSCGEDITYQLVNSEGFVFKGAGFITPFDGIVDSVEVAADGQQLILIDQDSVSGTTKFQLILSNTSNDLLLLSPDPQVINRDEP